MTRIALLLGLCAALPAVTFAAGKPLHGPIDLPVSVARPAPMTPDVADALAATFPFAPDGVVGTILQDPNWARIPPEYYDFNQADGDLDQAFRVFQRSDGGYWLAGLHRPTDGTVNDEIAIVKLDANGAPDTTFGSAGFATVASSIYILADVAMDDRDRLFFTGSAHTGGFSDYDFGVQCVDTTGTTCSDFPFPDTYAFDVGGNIDDVPTRIIFANGALYVTGAVETAGNDVAVGILKIDPTTGDSDNAFGDFGEAVFNLNYTSSGYDAPLDFAYAPSGKLVTVGVTQANTINDDYDAFTLVIDANSGAPDTDFSSTGWQRIFFDLSNTEKYDQFSVVTILRNGNYLAAGYSHNDTPQSTEFTAVVWTPDGELDPSFGDSGEFHGELLSAFNEPHAILEKADGNIVFAQSMLNDFGGSGDATITGIFEFDSTFATLTGVQTVEIDGTTGLDTEPASAIIDREKRLLVSGWRVFSGSDDDMWANRYFDPTDEIIFKDGFDGPIF
jgi:uncharacterized delta-60 repeat protein